ncbi:hypothetical protein GQ54DRAFT_176440 [Martensiomyces pterosporus]|nr:hypothetical protein GQ54DRAFT_176440 [Martensiomyces pterosporus]
MWHVCVRSHALFLLFLLFYTAGCFSPCSIFAPVIILMLREMHDFHTATFSSPTYCDCCGGFLWGLAKQGAQCKKCHMAVHKRCAVKIATKCTGDRGLAILLKSNGTQTPPSAAAAAAAAASSSESMTVTHNSSQVAIDDSGGEYMRQLDATFWEQVAEEAKINALVSTQAEQPLSLFQTLPANFMQFTAKLAPVGVVERGIRNVFLWKRPRNSVAAMCVYSMYCLRPNLLLATPLALLIAYIVFNYFNSGYAYTIVDDDSDDASSSSRGSSPGASSRQASALQFGSLRSSLFSIRPLSGASSVSTATAPIASVQRNSRLRDRKRRQASDPYPSLTNAPAEPSRLDSSIKNPDIPLLGVAADASAAGAGGNASAASDGVSSAEKRSAGVGGRHLVVAQQTKQADAAKQKSKRLVRAHDTPDSSGKRTRRRSNTDGRKSNSSRGSGGSGSGSGSGKTDFASILGVASFGSAKYTENVHTTQNLTGAFVGVYDWVAAHNYMVDWSHPQEARRILLVSVCAQMAVLFTVYWVPWYLLFLAGGNLGLLAMSPHVRAFVKVYGVEFTLYLHERIMLKWLRARRSVARMPIAGRVFARYLASGSSGTGIGTPFVSPTLLAQGSDGDGDGDGDGDDEDDGSAGRAGSGSGAGGFEGNSRRRMVGARSGYTTPPLLSLASSAGSSVLTLVRRPRTVSVFENQRWWLGFGWIPRLGSNERAKWSDESGKQRFASVSDFMPEEGYEWMDEGEGWEMDRRWALPVCTDEDGWVYSDNFWKHPAASASAVALYTRRRRWIRRMQPVASGVDEPAATAPAI